MGVGEEDHFPPLIETFVWVAGRSEGGDGGGGGAERDSQAQHHGPLQLKSSLGRGQASKHTEQAVVLQLPLLEAQL